jgi:signal transduction histidine kinase
LIAAACLVLALFQYRWTGELGRAEMDQAHVRIEGGVQRLAREFNSEVDRSAREFVPAPQELEAKPLTVIHAERCRVAAARNERRIFARVAVAIPDQKRTQLGLMALDQGTCELQPMAWPEAWAGLREHLTAIADGSWTGGPVIPPGSELLEFPVFGAEGRQKEREWVVFELDPGYVRDTWLPDLVRNHIATLAPTSAPVLAPPGGPDDGGQRREERPAEFRIWVRWTGDQAREPIFRSDREAMPEFAEDPPDAEAGLLPLNLLRFQSGPPAGPPEAALPPPRAGDPNDRSERAGPPPPDRKGAGFEDFQKKGFRKGDFPSAAGGRGDGKRDGRKKGRDKGGKRTSEAAGPRDFRWTITAQHRAGSIDAAVAATRRRNLAAALALLALIGITGALLVRFTIRLRELADMQFQFVAGVSHELRTPLTAIRGAGYNLLTGVAGSPEQRESYARMIVRHADHLTDMVEQLLSYASLRHNGRPVGGAGSDAQTSLPEVLSAAIESCSGELQAAGASVDLDVPADLPEVQGSPADLERVFRNLIGNAAKYAGGEILISAKVSGQVGVEVRVADSGPGVPKEEIPHLFDPFFRGKLAQESKLRGTGLGLSLVRDVVEAIGGRVELDQTVKQESASGPTSGGATSTGPTSTGSTFIVRLPAARLPMAGKHSSDSRT